MSVNDFGDQRTVALERIESDAATRDTPMLVLYDVDGYVVDWQIEREEAADLAMLPTEVGW